MKVRDNKVFSKLKESDFTNKNKGLKFDSGKRQWDLLPLKAVEEVVKVLEFGAKKYKLNNWKYVKNYRRRYFAACLRHLFAWISGERVDFETQLSHLAHCGCCLLFLLAKEVGKK